MKFIDPVLGTSAVRFSPEEVLPEIGVLQRELVARLGDRFAFHILPNVGQGVGPQHVLTFQAGFLDAPNGRIPITQAVIFPNALAVTAKNTELADAVLNSTLAECDATLGYRFGSAQKQALHFSQVIVEFDQAFVERSAVFHAVQRVLGDFSYGGHQELPHLKRLVFGRNDPWNELQTSLQQSGLQLPKVETLIPPDFMIERRISEPMEKNRFFCAAPMTTAEHRSVLEAIEHSVIAPS